MIPAVILTETLTARRWDGWPAGLLPASKLHFNKGFILQVAHPLLIHVLGLLLKHQCLNLALHLGEWPKLRQALFIELNDMPPVARLNGVGDLSGL